MYSYFRDTTLGWIFHTFQGWLGVGRFTGLTDSELPGRRALRQSLSLNLPGHRIAACLGEAALKTHALQTLSRCPLTWPRGRSVWSASDLSALSLQRGAASRSGSQRTRKSGSSLSMNTYPWLTPNTQLPTSNFQHPTSGCALLRDTAP